MDSRSIYKDIAQRTGGDIYIGVVGPVRTGKSTFIKKFMENLVIPNIESEFFKERAIDELPQSAAGKTIMTTEPKFIPEEAVRISLDNNAELNVRMIDCVGYIVPSSLGYVENEQPRMVMTPWFTEEIPFNMAAEIGTQKVIQEHSRGAGHPRTAGAGKAVRSAAQLSGASQCRRKGTDRTDAAALWCTGAGSQLSGFKRERHPQDSVQRADGVPD